MTRDWDLVRELLLEVEAAPAERPWSAESEWATGKGATLYQHLKMLLGAGFITVDHHDVYHGGGELWHRVNLTWAGHEFLDTIRSDTVWKETKRRIASTVGSVSLSVLTEVAKQVAKGFLGLP